MIEAYQITVLFLSLGTLGYGFYLFIFKTKSANLATALLYTAVAVLALALSVHSYYVYYPLPNKTTVCTTTTSASGAVAQTCTDVVRYVQDPYGLGALAATIAVLAVVVAAGYVFASLVPAVQRGRGPW